MIKKHTENGEITFDTDTKLYTVWDENYLDKVCETPYPKIAEKALEIYADDYLK